MPKRKASTAPPGLNVPEQDRIKASQSILDAFRQRAYRLRTTAFGILGVIFLLLIGGAATFVLAPQITLADFYIAPDLDKKVRDAEAELAELMTKRAKEERQYAIDWAVTVGPIYAAYRSVFDKFTREIQNTPGADIPKSRDILISDENIRQPWRIAEALIGISAKLEHVSVAIANEPGRPESFYILDTQDLRSAGRQVVDLIIPDLPPHAPLSAVTLDKIETLSRAIPALRAKVAAQAMSALVGDTDPKKEEKEKVSEDSKSKTEVPLAQLIQTNVTRFGTIIMITFLVSILTPLYRYNIRLATYYDARADVLALMDTKLAGVGFINLATALTPLFDFGKAPSTPIEQVIELARHLSGDKSKIHEKPE